MSVTIALSDSDRLMVKDLNGMEGHSGTAAVILGKKTGASESICAAYQPVHLTLAWNAFAGPQALPPNPLNPRVHIKIRPEVRLAFMRTLEADFPQDMRLQLPDPEFSTREN